MKRLLAYFSIIATLFFLAAVVALLFLATDIDSMHSGISFYALTRFGLIISLALAFVWLLLKAARLLRPGMALHIA